MSMAINVDEISQREEKSESKVGRKVKEGVFSIYHRLLESKRTSSFGLVLNLAICYFQVVYFSTHSYVLPSSHSI